MKTFSVKALSVEFTEIGGDELKAMNQTSNQTSRPRNVILDVDTGIDDSIALILAARSARLRVLGVTTVAGNVEIEKTTANTIRVLDAIGRTDIPVARGARQPLARPLKTAAAFHGPDGLGGLDLPAPTRPPVSMTAIRFLCETLRVAAEPVTLIALGPQTNLALALLEEPDLLAAKLERVIFMGGAVAGGNSTPAAEFNAWADPEAMSVVLHGGLALTMVPWDAIFKATLPRDEVRAMEIADDPALRLAGQLSRPFMAFFDDPEVVFCDPSAVAAAIDPAVVKTRSYHVDVETAGTLTTGMTVVDRRARVAEGAAKQRPNCEVAIDLDTERFRHVFREALSLG